MLAHLKSGGKKSGMKCYYGGGSTLNGKCHEKYTLFFRTLPFRILQQPKPWKWRLQRFTALTAKRLPTAQPSALSALTQSINTHSSKYLFKLQKKLCYLFGTFSLIVKRGHMILKLVDWLKGLSNKI